MQKKTQTVHIYLCRFQAASFIFHMGEVVFLLITNQCVLKYLRHWNDHEVQPVPRVSEKGEPVDGKTSGNNFCEWLKRIDTCKGIPFKDKKRRGQKRWGEHQMRIWLLRRSMEVDLLYLLGPLRGIAECHEYAVGQNRTHDDHAE